MNGLAPVAIKNSASWQMQSGKAVWTKVPGSPGTLRQHSALGLRSRASIGSPLRNTSEDRLL